MRVELDIYSGQPNPCWDLDAIAARGLRQQCERLPRVPTPAATPPALGYRGFRWQDGSAIWHAHAGEVTVGAAVYRDAAFSVERYLLATLPPAFAHLHARVQAAIERGGRSGPE
ncbi:hypothetical protein [Xanthomonas bundabergensis]|uniref:hypothetical protein n=1 Tax=Xanthomonas bundabergensis TaxID=3160842 RepID=UPI003513E5A5